MFTIADYWVEQGYSRQEAEEIERQQIKDAQAMEELYDSMD
jgi:hypothetical protein